LGVLKSDLFKDDARLEACATTPSAHIALTSPPQKGERVAKIHAALANLQPDGPVIADPEEEQLIYGPTTAEAVLGYKRARNIINLNYQTTADNIVGQMTIKAMDAELLQGRGAREKVVDQAFQDSRDALRRALFHLRDLRDDINKQRNGPQPNPAGMLTLLKEHQRDIAVVSRRLVIINPDPTSTQFRDALDKLIALLERNLAQPKTLLAAGRSGMCNLTLDFNKNGIPFALTLAGRPPPKTHLCEPFFESARDLQRDVVTHEYFHLFGLVDISVSNTSEALRNANTIAQIVAFIVDRFRQVNSDGNEPAIPLLPSP
jgi:hypothetical protein